MKRLIVLSAVGFIATVWGSLAGQAPAERQEPSLAQVAPPGLPVHVPPPQKPERIPTSPDEIAPQRGQRRHFDAEAARKNARELAELAQRIPGEVDQVSKDVLPKDLTRQLKQIEKLAKHLRTQISQ